MPAISDTGFISSSNLRAYYKFESGALTTDSSGNGYTLTNTNSVAEGNGTFGGGADLGTANTNKYMSIASNLGITSQPISVSLWYKAHAEIGTSSYELFLHRSESVDHELAIRYEYNGGTRRLRFFRNKRFVATDIFDYNISLGTTWHHLAYTYNGTTVRGFIDGSFAGYVASSGTGSGTTSDIFTLGFDPEFGTYANGIIDDACIFSAALNDNQVRQIYNSRYPKEINSSLLNDSRLVAYYRFQNNSDDSKGTFNLANTSVTFGNDYGLYGMGGTFNGSARLVGSSPIISSGPLTISFWMNSTANPSLTTLFANNDWDASSNGIAMFTGTTDGMPTVQVRAGGTFNYEVKGTINTYNGSWNNVVVTFTGDNTSNGLKYYVNGTLSAQTTAGSHSTPTYNIKIGSARGTASQYTYAGYMDEFAVFNQVLGTQEIYNIYNGYPLEYGVQADTI